MRYKLLFILLVACVVSLCAQDYTPNYQLINNGDYPTSDLAVAMYNVLDYGADPTGVEDNSDIFQTLLDKAAGVGVKSTERGNYANPATEISHLAFWYPDQKPGNITAYAPTILMGQSGYWGNEYCNVRHVTFVNSYIALQFNHNNGGGCPNIFDVYGTPLHDGLIIDATSYAGYMYTRVNTPGCETGVWLDGGAEGPTMFYGCHLEGSRSAVLMNTNATSPLMMQDCTVSGRTDVLGGELTANGCSFDDEVLVNPIARILMNGNSFTGSGRLTNHSIFKCFETVSARYIRITQTGAKGNYWSIHELNVANMDMKTTDMQPPLLADDADAETAVYTLQGVRVSESGLSPGIYVIVKSHHGQCVSAKKVI